METLEVRNVIAVRPNFQQVLTTVRTLPSLIIVLVAAKGILLYCIAIVLFIGSIVGGWKVAKGEKVVTRSDFNGIARTNPELDYSQQLNQQVILRNSHVVPTESNLPNSRVEPTAPTKE